jgi:hypothetical protein
MKYLESFGLKFPKKETVTVVNVSPSELLVFGNGTPSTLSIDPALTSEQQLAWLEAELQLGDRKLVRMSALEFMKHGVQALNMHHTMRAKKAQLVPTPTDSEGLRVMH